MAVKKKPEKPSSEAPAGSEHPDAPTPLGEIEQGPSKFEQFLENNQKKLFIGCLLVVLGVSGWIVVKGMREAKETSAGQAIVAAKDMGDFRNVIEQFAGTPAAGTAQLLLANEQWADGLQDNAIETLRKFLDSAPKHAAGPSARMTLANYLIEREQTDEAVALLEELAADQNSKHLAPLALVRLGDVESAKGNSEAAREFYDRAKKLEFKSSPLTDQLITSRLDAVGVALPVTVPRPKPPPPQIRPPLLPPGAPDNTASSTLSQPVPIPAPFNPTAPTPGVPPTSPPAAPIPTAPAPTPLPPTIPPIPVPEPEPAPAPEPQPEPDPAPEPEPAPENL